MTETKFTFTITGPTWLGTEGDVTDDVWGDEVPEPLTRDEITGLVECFSENSPVTWEESAYGTWGNFTSPVAPDFDEIGNYSITLDEVTA